MRNAIRAITTALLCGLWLPACGEGDSAEGTEDARPGKKKKRDAAEEKEPDGGAGGSEEMPDAAAPDAEIPDAAVDAMPGSDATFDGGTRVGDGGALIQLPNSANYFGSLFTESEDLAFEWTPDTLSVLVYVEADMPGTQAQLDFVSWLRGPDGMPIFEAGPKLDDYRSYGRPVRPHLFPGSGAFLIPEADALTVAPGLYTFRIAGTSAASKAYVVTRKGPPPVAGTLDLNLYFVEGCGLSSADMSKIETSLTTFYSIFQKANISRGTVKAIDLTGTDAMQFVTPRLDLSPRGNLRQLFTRSVGDNPLTYHIFFVRTFQGEDGILGVSMGIPAALTIHGTISSGSAVGVEGHRLDGVSIDFDEVGSTMAHETAHSMGLYHTTEGDGSHDLITDTPECPKSNDTDGDGYLTDAECRAFDTSNFLFWTGFGNRDVSAGQSYVLLHSPVVKGN